MSKSFTERAKDLLGFSKLRPTKDALLAERMKLAAEKAELHAQVHESATIRAKAYVQSQIIAGKMLPCEAASFEAAYALAYVDDILMPLSNGRKRVAAFEERQKERTSHLFFIETVGPEATSRILKSL